MPAAGILLAALVAKLTIAIDRSLPEAAQNWVFSGEAESARELLSTTASALMQFTAVVFSLTILVLQIASTQFSPRVLRTFLEDRFTRFTMACFLATFSYALTVLMAVRAKSSEHEDFVPAASVSLSALLLMASVLVFVRYIHHMAHSIRAVTILYRVGNETRRSLQRIHECAEAQVNADLPRAPDNDPDLQFLHDRPPGVIVSMDLDGLLQYAVEKNLVIELVPAAGQFVPRGAPLFNVWGQTSFPQDELREFVAVGPERTAEQDPEFGFRQLVDVAERALSPGVNDPTTAVQVLDQLHDLLRYLSGCKFPATARRDQAGALRLLWKQPSWDDYVQLAFEEIRHYGQSSIQVLRRTGTALDDLMSIAPASRKAVLREQRELVEGALSKYRAGQRQASDGKS